MKVPVYLNLHATNNSLCSSNPNLGISCESTNLAVKQWVECWTSMKYYFIAIPKREQVVWHLVVHRTTIITTQAA